MNLPIEGVYHDYKLVADSIVDSDSFQNADAGLLQSNLYDVVKVLEKQIPKEVSIMKYRNDYDWTCNSCNTTFEYIRYTSDKPNYCSNCGQALKW